MELPRQMTAVLLTGYGSFDKLVIRNDVPLPSLGAHEVLIRVGACGVNNTDINTRKGWYAPSVQGRD
jgi:NADPH:quinone reductase-like Zn-dependent oxidoreductase